ncbi:MAG TPA: hypothetical protein ENI42_01445 [Thermoplasmatales archaeon]|nr:hypothetical protein [Thermoplasmatales archaeon]
MNKIKQVENNLKTVLKHWGFGEICSAIYATLALSTKPLTAKEISKRINYAYTTTINALNHSIRLRHIKKMRQGKKNVYHIDADLADIIKEKLDYFIELLEDTENSIQQLDEGYRKKLKKALKTVDNAIKFLRKMRKAGVRA